MNERMSVLRGSEAYQGQSGCRVELTTKCSEQYKSRHESGSFAFGELVTSEIHDAQDVMLGYY
jgi:hypothetical protein